MERRDRLSTKEQMEKYDRWANAVRTGSPMDMASRQGDVDRKKAIKQARSRTTNPDADVAARRRQIDAMGKLLREIETRRKKARGMQGSGKQSGRGGYTRAGTQR